MKRTPIAVAACGARQPNRPFAVLLVVALAMSAAAHGQSDVAWFKNGDRLTGEIKALDRGRVSCDSPTTGVINLEWDDIAQLFSTTTFEVNLESGANLRHARRDDR